MIAMIRLKVSLDLQQCFGRFLIDSRFNFTPISRLRYFDESCNDVSYDLRQFDESYNDVNYDLRQFEE